MALPLEFLKQPEAKESGLSLIFVVFLFFTISWLAPESPWRSATIEPIKQFYLFWGLDQNWKLFSPEIRKINFHTEAILTFDDGNRLIVELPRMNRMNYADRFKLEKFRKWSVDSLPWPDYKEFWPDFARYLGRKYNCSDNQPQSLSLNLYYIEIPVLDLNKSQPLVPLTEMPAHTKMNTVFFYRYKPEDFKSGAP